MANDYFNHSANVIASGIRALAAQVNNIATEIGTGLDKLPTEIQFKRGTTRFAVDAGAANAYVVTLPYTPTLVDGLELSFRATSTNTGASTVNANATGAKEIVYFDKSSLTANAILVDSIVSVRYSSTLDQFVMQSQSGKVVSIGNADTLDTLDSTQFLRSDAQNVLTLAGVINALRIEKGGTGGSALVLNSTSTTEPTLATYGNSAVNTDPIAILSNLNSAPTRILLDLNHSGAGTAVDLSHTGSGDAIAISHTGASGQALEIIANNASRTQSVVTILQSHASASGPVLEVDQLGTGGGVDIEHTGSAGNALDIQRTTGTGNSIVVLHQSSDPAVDITVLGATGKGLNISHTGTNGICLDINANNASRAHAVVNIVQDHASSGANAVSVQQDGGGDGLRIETTITTGRAAVFTRNVASAVNNLVRIEDTNATGAAGSNDALFITQASARNAMKVEISGDAKAIEIIRTTAGSTAHLLDLIATSTTASGNVIEIDHRGTGNGINVDASNSAGRAGRFYSTATSRTVPVVEIINDNATGSGAGLGIRIDGTGNAIDAEAQSAAGTAARFWANIANRTQPVVEIINDNATGAGQCLAIQQDQSGTAILVEANNAITQAVVDIDLSGSASMTTGAGLRVIGPTTGGSTAGALVSCNTQNVSNAAQFNSSNAGATALGIYSNIASRTAPLMFIENDAATGSGVALRIQSDQGAAIEMLGNGQIKFPATNVPSTDANTLDDYQEGTWTPVLNGTAGSGIVHITQEGNFTKIGNVVFFRGLLAISTKGTVTGDLTITGLPFININPGQTPVMINGGNFNIAVKESVTGMVGSPTTRIDLYLWDLTTGTSSLDASEVTDTVNFYFSGFYLTAT